VPVLVQDARPTEQDLPDGPEGTRVRNGTELTHAAGIDEAIRPEAFETTARRKGAQPAATHRRPSTDAAAFSRRHALWAQEHVGSLAA
jgi:hypothetical protein